MKPEPGNDELEVSGNREHCCGPDDRVHRDQDHRVRAGRLVLAAVDAEEQKGQALGAIPRLWCRCRAGWPGVRAGKDRGSLGIDCGEDGEIDPLNWLDEDLLVRAGTLVEERNQDDANRREEDERQREEDTAAEPLTWSQGGMERSRPESPGPPSLVAAKTAELIVERCGRTRGLNGPRRSLRHLGL